MYIKYIAQTVFMELKVLKFLMIGSAVGVKNTADVKLSKVKLKRSHDLDS